MSTDKFSGKTLSDDPVQLDDILNDKDDPDKSSINAQEKDRYVQDTKHRHTLIIWMVCVISIWLAGVITVVVLNGSATLDVNDNVMITLLATTTANVLGLPTIILKDLFKGR